MIHSYDEIYTAKAQTSLAQMLRYAEEDLHIGLNEFWDMFLISGVADLFGQVGPQSFLMDEYGLRSANIVAAVQKAISTVRRLSTAAPKPLASNGRLVLTALLRRR